MCSSSYAPTKPFNCYFCNQLIKNDTEFGHLSICGMVLEACTNKCGSYIPRNRKLKHLAECNNRSLPRRLHHGSGNFEKFASHLDLTDRTQDMNNGDLQHATFNRVLSSNIFSKMSIFDQLFKQLFHDVNVLKIKQQEVDHSNQTNQLKTQAIIDKLMHQYETMSEWKRLIDNQMIHTMQELKSIKEMENQVGSYYPTDSSVKEMKASIDHELLKIRIETREILNTFQASLEEIKDNALEEKVTTAALWNDHEKLLVELHKRIEKLDESLKNYETKQNAVNFDIRNAVHIAADALEKVEMQDKLLTNMCTDIEQLKIVRNNTVSVQEQEAIVFSKPGRLLWKISDYSQQMESAKNNDTVLKSSVFYSHDFGYKLRIDLYLNGVKKWKGRHMLACIRVLKGDYDMLLQWPCHIEGTIILRDISGSEQAKDITKYITAKRQYGDADQEDPSESSTEYVFIPHSTATKSIYVGNDTIFLDVRCSIVEQINETNL